MNALWILWIFFIHASECRLAPIGLLKRRIEFLPSYCNKSVIPKSWNTRFSVRRNPAFSPSEADIALGTLITAEYVLQQYMLPLEQFLHVKQSAWKTLPEKLAVHRDKDWIMRKLEIPDLAFVQSAVELIQDRNSVAHPREHDLTVLTTERLVQSSGRIPRNLPSFTIHQRPNKLFSEQDTDLILSIIKLFHVLGRSGSPKSLKFPKSCTRSIAAQHILSKIPSKEFAKMRTCLAELRNKAAHPNVDFATFRAYSGGNSGMVEKEDLRKWFRPLVLVNEQNVSPYRNTSTSVYQIMQHIYDNISAADSTNTLKLRLVDLPKFLSTGLAQLHEKYLSWIHMTDQTYVIPKESQFVSSIQPYLNVSSEIILDEINVNDLSTFDHPVASINIINSLETDPLSNLRRLLEKLESSPPFATEIVSKEILHVTIFVRYQCFVGTPRNQEFDEIFNRLQSAFPDMLFYEIIIETMVAENGNLDPNDLQLFNNFMKEFSTNILPQYLQKYVSAGMLKINSPSNVTYGFAAKFLSIGKKYIPTGGLFKQEIATKSITAISKLTYKTAEYESRRTADICFMMGNYKEAFNIYDNLSRDFHNSKVWAHHYSAVEWSLYAKCMLEDDYRVNAKSIDGVVQFYLSHEEYHLNALKVLSLLMLEPSKMVPNALFLLCSRITQANIIPLFKVPLMIQQAIIAVSAEPSKNRLASFLFMLASSIANEHDLWNYAITYQKMSLKNIADSRHLRHVVKFRLAKMLEKYSIEPELLSSLANELMTEDRILTLEEQEFCLQTLARGDFAPANLRTKIIQIGDLSLINSNGKSYNLNLTSSNFNIDELKFFEKYCESLFLTHSLLLDPLDIFLSNEEQTFTVHDRCKISLTLKNIFYFEINLSDFKLFLLDQNNVESEIVFDCEIKSIDLPDGSSTVLYFPLSFSSLGKYRPLKMTCLLSGRISLQFDFADRGFRLNYKKKHRIENAYSLNHRMIFNVLDRKLGKIDFVDGDKEPMFSWEKGAITMRLSNPAKDEPIQVSIIILNGNLTVVGNVPLENMSLAASGVIQIAFNIEALQGDADFVFGILWKLGDGYKHRIIRHKLMISDGLVLSRYAIRGLAAPINPLLVIQLLNKFSSPISIKSATFIVADTRVASLNSSKDPVGSGDNHFLSFVLPHLDYQDKAFLEVCLALGNRLLQFPIVDDTPYLNQKLISLTGQSIGESCLLSISVKGNVDETILIDNPKTQSMWIGDIVRRACDGDDLRDTRIFAANGGYAHLRLLSDDPSQTFDIIIQS